MIEHSPTLDLLGPALANAQAAIEAAAKDRTNPQFGSKYADLASVWDACRVPLTENGLSVSQWPGGEGTAVTLTTMLLHSSGQWIKGTASATAPKDNAQGVGSVITYLRRYGLAAVAGVIQEDDDGNAGSKPKSAAKRSEGQAGADTERTGGRASPVPTAPSVAASASPARLPKGFDLAGQPVAIFAKPDSPLAGQTLDRLTDQQLTDMFMIAAKKEGYTAWREAAEKEQARRVRAVPTSEIPKALQMERMEDDMLADRLERGGDIQ